MPPLVSSTVRLHFCIGAGFYRWGHCNSLICRCSGLLVLPVPKVNFTLNTIEFQPVQYPVPCPLKIGFIFSSSITLLSRSSRSLQEPLLLLTIFSPVFRKEDERTWQMKFLPEPPSGQHFCSFSQFQWIDRKLDLIQVRRFFCHFKVHLNLLPWSLQAH